MNKSFKLVGWIALFSILGLPLPAQATDPERLRVLGEWAKAITQIGLVPVFPLREDLHVGDIFIYNEDPVDRKMLNKIQTGKASLDFVPKWGNFDFNTEISSITSKYPNLPETPRNLMSNLTGNLTEGKPVTDKVPSISSGIFPPSNLKSVSPIRLQLVQFPDFTITTESEQGISALVPIEALAFGFRQERNKKSTVSLRIPAAETYGVSTDVALKALLKQLPGQNGQPTMLSLCDNFPQLAFIGMEAWTKKTKNKKEPKDADFYIRVVTEVYYTRAFDIGVSINNNSKTAINFGESSFNVDQTKINAAKSAQESEIAQNRANAAKIVADSKTADFKANPTPANQQAAELASSEAKLAQEKADSAKIIAAGEAAKAKISEEEIAKANAATTPNAGGSGIATPGASVTVVRRDSTSIGLRKVFPVPVAIGFRGIVFKVRALKTANGMNYEILNYDTQAFPVIESRKKDLGTSLKQKFGIR